MSNEFTSRLPRGDSTIVIRIAVDLLPGADAAHLPSGEYSATITDFSVVPAPQQHALDLADVHHKSVIRSAHDAGLRDVRLVEAGRGDGATDLYEGMFAGNSVALSVTFGEVVRVEDETGLHAEGGAVLDAVNAYRDALVVQVAEACERVGLFPALAERFPNLPAPADPSTIPPHGEHHLLIMRGAAAAFARVWLDANDDAR
jgi:hypothetical protein